MSAVVSESERRKTGETERLFAAVPLPEPLMERVREFQSKLPEMNGLRLLRPEQLHVTLVFIGEAGSEAREAAEEVVRGVPEEMGGIVRLGGPLLLPSPRSARVVTLEVDDEHGVVRDLYEHVMAGLERRGVAEREARPYRSHLTVARLRKRSRLQLELEGIGQEYPVESVRLYRSRLRPQGAEYTVLAKKDLSIGGSSKTQAEEE